MNNANTQQEFVHNVTTALHALTVGLLEKFSELGLLEEVVTFAHTNHQINWNHTPQDVYTFEYANKEVTLQITKCQYPKIKWDPLFYYVKEDNHIFTENIDEVFEFLHSYKGESVNDIT